MNFVLLLYFYSMLMIGAFTKRAKIIGGQEIDVRNAPYQAAIVFPHINTVICGGSIITNKHILTAAHCLYERDMHYEMLRIYVGISNLMTDIPSKFKIYNVYIHPRFTGEMTKYAMNLNDIAVVMIQGTIIFNEFQNKINLPKSNYRAGWRGLVSGWGMTYYGTENDNTVLRGAFVDIIEMSHCLNHYTFVLYNEQLCTLQGEGIGICTGDSGGPLIYNNEIIGIVSCNMPCAKGKPDIHTNVFSYLHFIEFVINK
ncbi:PREDICTED: chymotrypsin-2-like [Ceratosolen solmsi marchali]|uniref:Chymotrypsin-2-like n=1 Tax=Ceratosolen solmsi marchali TaxID=326594 RepID=A0AAJ7DYR6_9HYME|nr:PREDICTED: chymotrypsin-2-like [Ceratosolen solmsi marchali]